MAREMLQFDGSILEGGGQVLRITAALSAILGYPVTVSGIRAKRRKPGLQAQHRSGLQLVAQVCRGRLQGAELNSSQITLKPERIHPGTFTADTRTAGSTTLLLQAALPVALFASGPSRFTLMGGTNADLAPQIDFVQQVFQPIVAQHFGISFDVELARRGYYPVGKGEVRVAVNPLKQLPAITLIDKGTVVKFAVTVTSVGLPSTISKEIHSSALQTIKTEYPNIPIDSNIIQNQNSVGHGASILITATTSTGCIFSGDAISAPGKSPAVVGTDAARKLLGELAHGGCVDEHLQDQLLIFMALARGSSQVLSGPISLHTETAIHFASALTKATFTLTPVREHEGDQRVMIECEGCGHINELLQTESVV